ncbi:46259_t:CDS:2, partial [Gigaspora margarita]
TGDRDIEVNNFTKMLNRIKYENIIEITYLENFQNWTIMMFNTINAIVFFRKDPYVKEGVKKFVIKKDQKICDLCEKFTLREENRILIEEVALTLHIVVSGDDMSIELIYDETGYPKASQDKQLENHRKLAELSKDPIKKTRSEDSIALDEVYTLIYTLLTLRTAIIYMLHNILAHLDGSSSEQSSNETIATIDKPRRKKKK